MKGQRWERCAMKPMREGVFRFWVFLGSVVAAHGVGCEDVERQDHAHRGSSRGRRRGGGPMVTRNGSEATMRTACVGVAMVALVLGVAGLSAGCFEYLADCSYTLTCMGSGDGGPPPG